MHLLQATQRPDDRTLPVRVREGTHVRCSLNVPNYETARMVLADAADRGARPQDLRPGADAGTVVATSEVEDIPKGQAFAIVRTHYVSTKDAYSVIDRAMAIIARAGREVGADEPAQIEDVREILADIATVISGAEKVRSSDVLQRLKEQWAGHYGEWSAQQLAAALREHKVEIKAGRVDEQGGQRYVLEDDVLNAIAGPAEHTGDTPSGSENRP